MSAPDQDLHPFDDRLGRIVFVLDRPRDIGNVGAVVRLMGNFGLSRLRLIEPCAFDPERILTIARRGRRVLEMTERFASLDAALADCGLVFGATRRSRSIQRVLLTPRQAAPLLLAAAGAPPALEDAPAREPEQAESRRPAQEAAHVPSPLPAVLFGPEDFGLANAAIDRCHAIVQIPAVPEDASLNLAQSALVIAYELFLQSGRAESGDASPAHAFAAAIGDAAGLASGAALEELYGALADLLRALHPDGIEGRTSASLERLRSLFARAAPRSDEARLLSQILAHAARVARTTTDGSR